MPDFKFRPHPRKGPWNGNETTKMETPSQEKTLSQSPSVYSPIYPKWAWMPTRSWTFSRDVNARAGRCLASNKENTWNLLGAPKSTSQKSMEDAGKTSGQRSSTWNLEPQASKLSLLQIYAKQLNCSFASAHCQRGPPQSWIGVGYLPAIEYKKHVSNNFNRSNSSETCHYFLKKSLTHSMFSNYP